ncbi:hypothetical protein D3C76_736050 [compost metagenome]
MALLRILASVFMFVGILADCLALVLLVILLVRFPPLLIAVLLACWTFFRLLKALTPGTAAADSTTAPAKQSLLPSSQENTGRLNLIGSMTMNRQCLIFDSSAVLTQDATKGPTLLVGLFKVAIKGA